MPLTRADVAAYFSEGEIILSGGGRSSFEILAILDDRIRIQPIRGRHASRLTFDKIHAVIENIDAVDPMRIEDSIGNILQECNLKDTQNESYLYGFAKEFILRSTNTLEITADTKVYNEGQRKLITHFVRERNPQLIREAKTHFRTKQGHLYCEICGFNRHNEHPYGEAIIEGHHIVPVNQLSDAIDNTINNIALLCPNCHRMTHRYMALYPNVQLTKETLSSLILTHIPT